MEHILQFGISIDDEAIKKRVEESALDKITDEIVKDVRNAMFHGYNGYNKGLTQFAREIIFDAVAECKDEIIKEATATLTESLRKSKKCREALAKAVEDIENE